MNKINLVIFIVFCIIFSFSVVGFMNEYYPVFEFNEIPEIAKNYGIYAYYEIKNLSFLRNNSNDNNTVNKSIESNGVNSAGFLFGDKREYVFNYLEEHSSNDLRFQIKTYVDNDNFNIEDIKGFIETNKSLYNNLLSNVPKDLLSDVYKLMITEREVVNQVLDNYYNYCLTGDINYKNKAATINNDKLVPLTKNKHEVLIDLFKEIDMDYSILADGTLKFGYTKRSIGVFSN